MCSDKSPEGEADKPASRPQQKERVKKAKMAPQPTAAPGLEQDACGEAIPFEQRTEEDKLKARRGNRR